MTLILITLAAILVKSLDFLYLFQTKEYRIDRILNFIQEEDLFNMAFRRVPRLPAKSLRNILIFLWICLFITVLFLFLTTLPYILVIVIMTLFPFISLIIAISGIQITQVPAEFNRKNIVKKAAKKIAGSKTVFIGITGSYGKTTTKELLYQILAQKFRVEKTDKNYNSEVGVAISILKNLKPDTEFFIAELGAYKKGEIKATCELIHPRYGILTGIGNQHLSLFGSKQNLLDAKAELLEALPKNGTAYINNDIAERKFFAAKTKARKVFYSLSSLPDKPQTNLSGQNIVQNLLPGIALATDLGMTKKEIDTVLKKLKPVTDRLSETKGINGSTVLNDSYNSNLQGFELALQSAGKMTNFTKKFILSRGIIELGNEKNSSYQSIIAELNKTDLQLLTTDKLFQELDSKNKVSFFAKESLLLNYVKESVDNKSLIVIEGRFEPKTLSVLFAKP